MLPTDIQDALDGYVDWIREADRRAFNGLPVTARNADTEADKARDVLELRILNAINPDLKRD